MSLGNTVWLSVLLTLIFSTSTRAKAQLFAFDQGTQQLLELDPDTGNASVFANMEGAAISGLAGNGLGVVFAIDPVQQQLMKFDISSKVLSTVGNMGIPDLAGISFERFGDTLFTVSSSSGNLFSVDQATGATALVGGTGFNPTSLTYDASSNSLFAVDSITDQLLRIDPATASTSIVGPLGNAGLGVVSLASSADGSLLAVDTLTDNLLRLDPSTGNASDIGSVGFPAVTGMTFNSIVAVPEPALTGWLVLLSSTLIRRRRSKKAQES